MGRPFVCGAYAITNCSRSSLASVIASELKQSKGGREGRHCLAMTKARHLGKAAGRFYFVVLTDQRFGDSELDSFPFGSGGVVVGFCEGLLLAPVVGAMFESPAFMPPLDMLSFDMSLFILVVSCAAGPVACAMAAPDKPTIALAAIAAVKRFDFI
jgi:hypothetical protein